MAFRSSRHPAKLRAYQAADGFLARHATFRFHALTETVANEAVSALGISRDTVYVVPRGRDRTQIGEPHFTRRARVRANLGIAADVPVLLNVARQQAQKGLPLLINAFAHVAEMAERVVLLQAGRPGETTNEAVALMERLGLNDRVILLGRRPDVPDLLAAADVFVSSSLWEGQGGAVVEAMAMGLPIVAFDDEAVAETVGNAGVLVTRGDIFGMAEAVLELLADTARARAIGRMGRERFEEIYEISRVADLMRTMYREAASDWRSRG
jgi:glycosyltransferase involved in cell wall biosynthesis